MFGEGTEGGRGLLAVKSLGTGKLAFSNPSLLIANSRTAHVPAGAYESDLNTRMCVASSVGSCPYFSCEGPAAQCSGAAMKAV